MDLRLSPEDRVATGRGRGNARAARSVQQTNRTEPRLTGSSGAAPSVTGDGGNGGRGGGRRDTGRKNPGRGNAGRKRRANGVRPWSVWRAFGQLFKLGLVLAFWGVIAVVGVVAYYGAQLPDSNTWAVPERPANIRILAANGRVMSNRGQGGEAIAIGELPPYVGQALIAIEDRRFYQHFGVDPIGLAAVAVESLQAGTITRGASTLTQQLAKNMFLTPDVTLGRKVQEALLAVWLEYNYSKDEILDMYLNRMYFGAGAYGIEAAAQRYFEKSARNLTLGEAAILAGVVQAPSRLAPTTNPMGAAARARLVLNAMAEEGYITREEAAAAQIDTTGRTPQQVNGAEFYVADWVETLMEAYLGEVNEDVIVHTTIDWDMQQHAEVVIQQAINEYGAARNFDQAALVAMDTDGRIQALVGGVDYAQSQFNRVVTARRQPGSAFKPFVYLAALQQGYTPDTLMIDEPVNFNGWQPENYGRTYRGPVLLRDALADSINTIAAQLAVDVGPENVVETAYRMGFSSQFLPVPSIALGSQEVSLLELTGAYAPFANGGVGVIPSVITRITTMDGEVLYEESQAGPGQILTNEQVGMMNDMLRAAVQEGTGGNANFGGWPVAGKTGTTQSSRDALFIGYTARLVAGVWLGNDDDSPTSGMTGGAVPSRIWAQFMAPAHQGLTIADLPGSYVRLGDRIAQPAAVDEFGNPVPGAPVPQPGGGQLVGPVNGGGNSDGIGMVLNDIFGAPPQ